MVSGTLLAKFNEQINREFNSSYLYLSMALYAESINFPGFAKWLTVQSQEEWGHAMKMVTFLQDRGVTPTLSAVAAPPADFKSPVNIFREVLKHEKYITENLNALYETALAEKDYPAQFLLQWFITEQVEEEKTATDILALLEMAGEHVIVLDHRLGKRGE